MKDNMVNDEFLDKVSGGTLPENWQQTAYTLIPQYKKIYPNATYQDACNMLKLYFKDPNDYAEVCEFAKQFFDENGNQL